MEIHLHHLQLQSSRIPRAGPSEPLPVIHTARTTTTLYCPHHYPNMGTTHPTPLATRPHIPPPQTGKQTKGSQLQTHHPTRLATQDYLKSHDDISHTTIGLDTLTPPVTTRLSGRPHDTRPHLCPTGQAHPTPRLLHPLPRREQGIQQRHSQHPLQHPRKARPTTIINPSRQESTPQPNRITNCQWFHLTHPCPAQRGQTRMPSLTHTLRPLHQPLPVQTTITRSAGSNIQPARLRRRHSHQHHLSQDTSLLP